MFLSQIKLTKFTFALGLQSLSARLSELTGAVNALHLILKRVKRVKRMSNHLKERTEEKNIAPDFFVQAN